MALILSIDTATERAVVCMGDDEKIIYFTENADQKSHASFVQPAIEAMIRETGIALLQVDAIAVSIGPGSYTGLRVGLASAKGIAYALNKPLIALNTLDVMAKNAILQFRQEDLLYCPMIDARRMEVFTAVYNASLENIYPPAAVVLTENTFQEFSNKDILFFGSGMPKWKAAANRPNARYATVSHIHEGLNTLAINKFHEKEFADVAYAEPYYIKSFYTKAATK